MKKSHKVLQKPNFEIHVIDDVPVEANAMIQALYSRDPQSVITHLQKVKEVGHEKFMASYYVGYGHKSIGDCGSTTIYAENVSILAAKAIQDWRLYNGQEASTRYLDMNKQAVFNPLGTKAGEKIQATWMNLYNDILEELIPYLKTLFPIKPEEKEATYEKAIKVKAFDIARGFLPAGITTYASWHTNLRQAYDHLHLMFLHPLEEIRTVADQIHKALQAKYPSSFSHKIYPDQEAYLAKSVAATTYYDRKKAGTFSYTHTLDIKGMSAWKDLLKTRPIKTELSNKFEKFGQIKFQFPLDFGSFRDLQRHRSGVNEMPLLSTKHGFFKWYLESLSPELRKKAQAVIQKQEAEIKKLKCDDATKQYYTAMGYTVACELTVGLPAAIYIVEIRSPQTVHATLRKVAQEMGTALKKIIPSLALYVDEAPTTWTIKRGEQDIVKKPI